MRPWQGFPRPIGGICIWQGKGCPNSEQGNLAMRLNIGHIAKALPFKTAAIALALALTGGHTATKSRNIDR